MDQIIFKVRPDILSILVIRMTLRFIGFCQRKRYTREPLSTAGKRGQFYLNLRPCIIYQYYSDSSILFNRHFFQHSVDEETSISMLIQSTQIFYTTQYKMHNLRKMNIIFFL